MSSFKVSKKAVAGQSAAALEHTPVNHSTRVEILSTAVNRHLETPEEFIDQISTLWSEAQQRFLAIGRYLVLAHAKFSGYGEYDRNVLKHLPFSRQVAHQLRTIAKAVDKDKLLQIEELPRSYTTAYFLVSLPPEHINQARQEGLTKPTTTRAEIQAFRKRVLTLNNAVNLDLAARRARLRADIERRETELAALKAELEEIGDDEEKSNAVMMDRDDRS
jgi:hypothetical protein